MIKSQIYKIVQVKVFYRQLKQWINQELEVNMIRFLHIMQSPPKILFTYPDSL